jgi:predicted nucleotidyltransferase
MSRMLQLGTAQVDETTLADLCRRYRVRELSSFGSAARGEMRPDSDIDILVEFLPGAEIDLVDYCGLIGSLHSARAEGRSRFEERGVTSTVTKSCNHDLTQAIVQQRNRSKLQS